MWFSPTVSFPEGQLFGCLSQEWFVVCSWLVWSSYCLCISSVWFVAQCDHKQPLWFTGISDVKLLVLMFCYRKVLFLSVWLSGFMVCWTVTSLSHWARNWANYRHGSNRRLRKSDVMLVSMQSVELSCKMVLQHSMNMDFRHNSHF